MVPLVPVDQLPVQLQGIPCHLSHRQISDQGWKFVTETDELASQMTLRGPNLNVPSHDASAAVSNQDSKYRAPDYRVRSEIQHADTSKGILKESLAPRMSTLSAEESGTIHVNRSEQSKSLADSFAAIYQQEAHRLGYRPSHPSGIRPDQSKKEYCTHWIKTGECAFISIGCKYKHEMPTSEKLRALGFTRGVPRWWKEKSAIASRGPTWMQRRIADGSENSDLEENLPSYPERLNISMWRNHSRQHLNDENTKPTRTKHLHRRANLDEHAIASISLSEAATTQASCPTSPITDLLIDVDDSPVPPSSSQSSITSSTNDANVQAPLTARRSSMSFIPLSSPRATKVFIKESKANALDIEPRHAPVTVSGRRHSRILCAADSPEHMLALNSTSPVSEKRKNHCDSTMRRHVGMSQSALASSKHACRSGTSSTRM